MLNLLISDIHEVEFWSLLTIHKKMYQIMMPIRGVTRGGRVAHPWKVWREFCKEGGNDGRGKKGREREKEEEREQRGKGKGKMEGEMKGNLWRKT